MATTEPAAANLIENAVGVVQKTGTKIGKLRNILSFCGNFLDKHAVVITNLILAALTYGSEELLEFTFFRCPSSQPAANKYAMAYTFGIAATLWLFGIAVYNVTWKIFHGCVCCCNFYKICYGVKEKRNCCCCRCSKICDTSCGDACIHPVSKQCYLMSFGVFVKTSVAPFAWCLICLWDGDYMACGFSETPGDKNSTDYLEWKSESQFYGYLALPGYLGVMIFFQAVYRCCIKQSYRLHRYLAVYKESEEKEFRDKMSESAGKLSGHVVTSFFKQIDLKADDWNEAETTENAEKTELYYSSLHKCVLENKWLKLVKDGSPQTIITVEPNDTRFPRIEPSSTDLKHPVVVPPPLVVQPPVLPEPGTPNNA